MIRLRGDGILIIDKQRKGAEMIFTRLLPGRGPLYVFLSY